MALFLDCFEISHDKVRRGVADSNPIQPKLPSVQTLNEQHRQDSNEATFADTRPTLNPIHILLYLPRSILKGSVAITSDLVT